jgi:hypothetical protein
MWLPLWPIAIGAMGVRYIPSIPIPDMILKLAPEPSITWAIYGAFCGLISTAVVKGIKQALEKKGIDLEMPDLKEAKLAVKNGNGKPKLEEKPEKPEEPEEPEEEESKTPDSDKEPEESEKKDEESKEESGESEKD